jgi:putative transposase
MFAWGKGKMTAEDRRFTELLVSRRPPGYIRSDNGPEFTRAVREWLIRVGVKTVCIEPGSAWENGYNESFNGKLRDELCSTGRFSIP